MKRFCSGSQVFASQKKVQCWCSKVDLRTTRAVFPNHQRWYAKWKLSRNIYTSHTRFCTFGTDLYAQSVIINNISASELSRKFIKSALLVGFLDLHAQGILYFAIVASKISSALLCLCVCLWMCILICCHCSPPKWFPICNRRGQSFGITRKKKQFLFQKASIKYYFLKFFFPTSQNLNKKKRNSWISNPDFFPCLFSDFQIIYFSLTFFSIFERKRSLEKEERERPIYIFFFCGKLSFLGIFFASDIAKTLQEIYFLSRGWEEALFLYKYTHVL